MCDSSNLSGRFFFSQEDFSLFVFKPKKLSVLFHMSMYLSKKVMEKSSLLLGSFGSQESFFR